MSRLLGRRPFRGSSAIASGQLTSEQLRSGSWRRLFQDVYVDARVPVDQRLLIQAAALRLPDDAVITGRSAAHLWGAKLGCVDDPVEVIASTAISAKGIRGRTGRIAPGELTRRYGVIVPTIVHTAWELARTLPMLEAVPWIDQLARVRRLDRETLVAHAASHSNEWRCVQAARTLERCDGRAESPPESILRIRMELAGIPHPVPQYEVFSRNGLFIARVDFGFPEICLALEYDGQWHADRNQLARDRERIRNLNAAGWYVFPVTSADMRDPDRLMETIRRLVARRSALFQKNRGPDRT